MARPEIVIRAKVKGAAAIYLNTLRDGTRDPLAFVDGLESGITHCAPFDTATRALAMAVLHVKSASTHFGIPLRAAL
ncbi:hypothetical protein [Paraburkholderia aromaticivorans]|uniref:hypothetical protein n=1 Tax=Paraburkholderia aromaticivorans TaxID=2026199 RepID=UPI001455F92D|nr:hypothetical protein [Paraburkholderia aromaticivorans]